MANSSTKPIFVAGRIVAVLRGSVLDIRKKQSHVLRTPPAICLSADGLTEAESKGATTIKCSIVDTGKVLESTVQNFRRFSFPIRRSGFESQLALGLSYWRVVDEGCVLTGETPAHASAPAQISMFG